MSELRNKTPSHPVVPISGPSSGAPTSEPMSAERVTGSPSSAPELSGRDREITRMKIVTLAPPTSSVPDVEATSSQRRSDPYLGATIDGRYKVEALLGEGGMGVVYRCVHTIIGKKVAMKVLRADLARDAEVTERFLNEAKSASAIGNPHIIDISDFGQLPDGSTYFVMEFLTGSALSKAIESGPMPVPRIIHIARQLAEGLSAAHAAGIVHRDLKPDNIVLVERGGQKDFVKILDFGIAKVSTSEGRLTRAGAVFGTPHYMAPEQAAGAPVDHRGDIYSFGVILYELASGRVPFDADNFMGILTQHMYKAPVPIRALVPQPQDVPPGLEAIVLKCLSKRPEHRYQSMDELLVDLEKLREGHVPDAVGEMMARSGGFNVPADYFQKAQMPALVPATPASLANASKSRWPLVAGLVGSLAAVGIVVAIFAKSGDSSASAAPPTQNAATEPPRAAEPETAPPPVATSAAATPANGKQVVLAAEPLDAHVFRDGADLGASPLVIEVPAGQVVEVEIQRKGYKSETLKIDGSAARQVVKLERVVPGGATRPAVKPAKPVEKPAEKPAPKKKTSGTGEIIVDPWD
jgi:serine/threonine protein kinase